MIFSLTATAAVILKLPPQSERTAQCCSRQLESACKSLLSITRNAAGSRT